MLPPEAGPVLWSEQLSLFRNFPGVFSGSVSWTGENAGGVTLLMRWWRLCSRLELLRRRQVISRPRQPFQGECTVALPLFAKRRPPWTAARGRGYSDCGPGARASSMGLSWFTASLLWFIPSARETRSLLSSGSRRDPCGLPEARSTGRVRCPPPGRWSGPLGPWAVVACRLLRRACLPWWKADSSVAGESQGLKPQLKTPEGCGGHYL